MERYKKDWRRALAKHEEYWARENHDRPLLVVNAPLGKAPAPAVYSGSLEERWLDIGHVIKTARHAMERTYLGGDAIPIVCPDLGPDLIGAICGCGIKFGEDTSWAQHTVDSWETTPDIHFDENNIWWRRIADMTQALCEDSRGDYLVGIADLHPSYDALMALRGPELLCMDIATEPDVLARFNDQVHEVFKAVFDGLLTITSRYQKGTSNWLGLYHPKRWYVTSCDFIYMISPEMLSEYILGEIVEEIAFLERSVFHLDGVGSLRHLDRLLQIPGLNGVQWVPGAGKAPASEWIPVLKRIQDSGKIFHIDIQPQELPMLVENLKPKGACYRTWCQSPEAADLLVSSLEKPNRDFVSVSL